MFHYYHLGLNLWDHTPQRDPYLIMELTWLGIVSMFKSRFLFQLSFDWPDLGSIWSSLGLPGIIPRWLGLNPCSSNGLMNCSKSNWFLFKSISNWFQLESMWFDCRKLGFDLIFVSSPVSIDLDFVWVVFGLNQNWTSFEPDFILVGPVQSWTIFSSHETFQTVRKMAINPSWNPFIPMNFSTPFRWNSNGH